MKQKVGIGIDLGGTYIKYALGNQDGEILKEGKRPTDAQADSGRILEQISESIMDMVQFAHENKLSPSVVGIGTPGCVDVSKGMLKGSTPNFKSWKKVDIGLEIEKRVRIPAFIDNDANLMALAEARFGAARGHQNVICLTIGTGIGGGVIINGNLYRGSHYAGAELGHMSIKVNGLKCRCGGQGCLERYTSAPAMIAHYKKFQRGAGQNPGPEGITVKDIFNMFKSGDPYAAKTVEVSTYYLGRGIANLMNIFNPTRIVIGGGVADAGKVYLDKVSETAFAFAMENAKENVKIVKAKLGNKAGYIGAIALAFDQMNKSSEKVE
ncbi:MAG: ROK family protein [Calditrichales bacterium]|nr:MAG: ROK family protein [Calditrichales bacterium]